MPLKVHRTQKSQRDVSALPAGEPAGKVLSSLRDW